MQFVNPHETSDEDIQAELQELARTTIFSYDYLRQEVRRCFGEKKVLIIVDNSHTIDWDYNRFHADTPKGIQEFIEKWAPKPPEVSG